MTYTVPTQASKAGTGSEVTQAIPANCTGFWLKSSGGTTTYSWSSSGSAAGTPLEDGVSRPFNDANLAGRTIYLTMAVGVTAFFNFHYDN